MIGECEPELDIHYYMPDSVQQTEDRKVRVGLPRVQDNQYV